MTGPVTGPVNVVEPRPPDRSTKGPARLDIENLVVSYGGLRAVNDASLAVEAGAIVGLIGANGSGKTTLLDAVSGLVSPAGGKLLLDQVDMADYRPEERARLGMVRSFQDCRLYPELSVEDTLMLCEDARRRVSVLATTLQMPWARRAEREKRQAIDGVIASFGLERFRLHQTAHLSTGTRRVVDLASIVLANPRLLLLDEPTAGIAQREAEAFIPLLQRLHEVTDSTILLVEHDVPLVFELCSTVVVMQAGEVVAAGTPDEVRRDPKALAAYLGASDEALNVSGPLAASSTAAPPADGHPADAPPVDGSPVDGSPVDGSPVGRMTVGALDGIRVLDLSQGIAGPLGVLFLAEHGADVIKVEPPGGDPSRAYEGSRCWNRSRRSVIVDLTSTEGRDRFRDLAAGADVVVESFRPSVARRLGLGYEDVAAIDDRLIVVSCPAYPSGHPLAERPTYDALVQASSGQMWAQPGWRPGPIFLHMPVPSMGAAFLVSAGAVAAVYARHRTGRGQHVRTSLLQGALLYTTQLYQDVENPGAGYHELMAKTYPPGIHQTMLFACAAGRWIHISVMSGLPPLKTLDEVIGLDDAPDILTLMGLSSAERAALDVRRRQAMTSWDAEELVEQLRLSNHAAEVVGPAHEVLRHGQTIANHTVATVDDPDIGATRQMGVPIHLLGTPGQVKGPQPRAGAHTNDVFGPSAGPVWAAAAGSSPDAAAGASPFALGDVRVIDVGQYLAGPFGPMILSDLGADVIKVEPVTGDSMRFSAKPFIGCQRGKRSVALDLKHPSGKEVMQRLVAGADVVHHNMTRGVATRLGIDYAACRAWRPDIIYCNTYAYGLDDPLGRFGGLDPLYQASSGIEYDAGAVADGNDPLYLRFGMCDTANAMLSVVGVLLALAHRAGTGEGQELWTSLHDGGIVFTSDAWTGADGVPWDRPRLDADLNGTDALYRLYRTADDGWICLAAVTEDHWRRLGAALALDELADDERFSTAAARRVHRRTLEERLQAVLLTRPAAHWTRVLDDGGVPNQIPVDTDDGRLLLTDETNASLGLVAEYEHPVLGRLRQFGQLIDLSATPGRIAGPPPLVGQHTRPVLRQVGYRDGDIDTLIADGVAYEPDDGYSERFVT